VCAERKTTTYKINVVWRTTTGTSGSAGRRLDERTTKPVRTTGSLSTTAELSGHRRRARADRSRLVCESRRTSSRSPRASGAGVPAASGKKRLQLPNTNGSSPTHQHQSWCRPAGARLGRPEWFDPSSTHSTVLREKANSRLRCFWNAPAKGKTATAVMANREANGRAETAIQS